MVLQAFLGTIQWHSRHSSGPSASIPGIHWSSGIPPGHPSAFRHFWTTLAFHQDHPSAFQAFLLDPSVAFHQTIHRHSRQPLDPQHSLGPSISIPGIPPGPPFSIPPGPSISILRSSNLGHLVVAGLGLLHQLAHLQLHHSWCVNTCRLTIHILGLVKVHYLLNQLNCLLDLLILAFADCFTFFRSITTNPSPCRAASSFLGASPSLGTSTVAVHHIVAGYFLLAHFQVEVLHQLEASPDPGFLIAVHHLLAVHFQMGASPA